MAKFSIKQVKQLTVEYENKPGQTAKLATALADANINLHGFSSITESHDDLAIVHFVTDQDQEAMKVIESLGFKADEQSILELQYADAQGVLAKLATAYGEAGVNMLNVYISTPGNSAETVMYVEVQGDLAKATEVAAGVEL